MSFFSKIGHVFKIAAEDTGKVVIYPFTHAAHFASILGEALEDVPAVKTATVELVRLADVVVADGGVDVATKGTNVVADVQTAEDVRAFFAYFGSTFLPAVETAYKDIKTQAEAK